MSTLSKAEKEKLKLIQDKCQTMLNDMLRDEDNKYCVDCDAKGPRWASWNLGIYLCIRCAGIHRNLGVHISKVKSVNLDTWTPEQVMSMTGMGNSKGRAVYEANLPDNFRRPQTDVSLENFIRAKYEHKKYIAKEWVASPRPTKVDWSAEIEEQIHHNKNYNNSKKKNVLTVVGKPAAAVAVVVAAPTTTTTPKSVAEKEEPKTIDLFDGLDLNPPPPVSSLMINNTNLLSNELESLFLDQPATGGNASAMMTDQQQKMTNTHILSLYSSNSNQQNTMHHPSLFLQQGPPPGPPQPQQQSQPAFNLFWKQ